MIIVKPFSYADSEAIARLMVESYHYYGESVPKIERIIGWLRNLPAGVELLLAEDPNARALAGFAGFSTLFPGPVSGLQLYVKEVYVGSAYRSQNVGHRLFLEILRIAQQRNYSCVDWVTGSGNAFARRCYKSMKAERNGQLYYRLADDNIGNAIAQLTKDILVL